MTGTIMFLLGHLKDGMLDISKSSLDCDLDLWHDPKVEFHSMFISDDLRNALAKAKLDKLWDMHSCKLV